MIKRISKKIRIRLVLAPIDRALEVLGGVIMVLTFTSVLSVSHGGNADVNAMLIGSLGCNLAWGIIDGIMYLMNCLAARGHELDALRAMRAANDPNAAERTLAAELPEQFAAVLYPGELEPLLARLRSLPAPSARPHLTGDDWLGAFGICGLVFFSTLPVVLPFVLVAPPLALRVSNLVAISLLFLTGYVFGRNIGHNPWRLGITMVLLGCLLAGVAISLGG
ncbi:MAG: VIT1/CCC1 transporter family protein [Verrucomicrobia bacterium]|nr:VIT1/CCC1 transporter family protein [Verrucomicrobiota bacterium]MBV8641398.1 VIT1/CCC1 transporter family protein [Verrucomicrobiota bacterium]